MAWQRVRLETPHALVVTARATVTLTPNERTHLCRLAEFALGDARAGKYVERRFATYDGVLSATHSGRVLAFALIESFRQDGALHGYVGPMFSRGGASLPMLVEWIDSLLVDSVPGPLHLAAEIENPRLLTAVSRLFGSALCPGSNGEISLSAVHIARRFAGRVRHISGFDPSRFSTRSVDALYSRGEARFVVVSCGDSASDRDRFRLRMRIGLEGLRGAKARTGTAREEARANV
jgi:hypothetical protein